MVYSGVVSKWVGVAGAASGSAAGVFSTQPSPAALGRQLPPPGTGGKVAGADVGTSAGSVGGVVLGVMVLISNCGKVGDMLDLQLENSAHHRRGAVVVLPVDLRVDDQREGTYAGRV